MNDAPDILSHLDLKSPWNDALFPALERYGFEEPKQAWRNLITLRNQANFPELYPGFFPAFLEALSQSYNADIALNNFERLAQKIPDKEHLYSQLTLSPRLLKILVMLFSGSQVLTDTVLANPAHVDWLNQANSLCSKTRDVLYRDFYALAGTGDPGEATPTLLRRFKKREYIRIGLRDLMGLVDLQENVESLSDLADVCLQVAYEYAYRQLTRKHGVPMYEGPDGQWRESEFTILSMGKLGGRELNYSSDIDLIYIYTSSHGETRKPVAQEGEINVISNHEFHTKQAQIITRAINEMTPEGNVFRVDLDLRPQGRSGEIVNSLASCETYYQSWGRTWERQAMIKARVSAGSETLGREFITMIRPFVYRRSLDFAAIEEIKALKKKVDLDLKQKNKDKDNIKLGYGGIREVEFIVQSYQLLFGGRDPSLREPNTLTILDKLKERGFLEEDEYHRLREAYIFLRNLENRIQITFGLQTYHLPKGERERAVLARKMGLKGKDRKELIEKLLAEIRRHTDFVGTMFAELFSEDQAQQAATRTSTQWDVRRNLEGAFSPELLERYSFRDPKRTYEFLKALRDGQDFPGPSEKSIQTFYRVLPSLLELSTRVPDPNMAIANLVKFIEASRARDAYLNLFLENEKFLELLLILFGSGEVLSELLIRQPNLIDVLSNPDSLYRFKNPDKMREELVEGLKNLSDVKDKNIWLRRFKQAEELRIGLRYLIHETDLPGTLSDLSNLADIFLQTVLELSLQDLARGKGVPRVPDRFAIFGLGKLGGRELNFGSDLDIIFVYDDESVSENTRTDDLVTHYTALARKIYQLSSEMTPAGIAYKIDTDLRPEGSSGALALSFRGYEDYFRTRGRIWEQQAMTRARFIAGDEELGQKLLKAIHSFTYRSKLEYGSLIEISRLRERMEKELAQEARKGKNVKLGYGGLADIEFSIQVLQLMHGGRHPKLRETNTLSVMRTLSWYGILPQEKAEALSHHYLFLRNLECALRLLSATNDNYLPREEEKLEILARMLGYQGESCAKRLMAEYEEVTSRVREFYRANLDTLLRTAL